MGLERQAFGLRHLYVYPRLRIAYTYIPKNACTTLKATFGLAQGWLTAEAPDYHGMTAPHWLEGLAAYPLVRHRVVVLRDPFDRLLSAYLHRFVLQRGDPVRESAMGSGLGAAAGVSTAAEVSFAGFLRYLALTPDDRLNEHWRPQRDFLVGDYTHVVRFDHLVEDLAFLRDSGITLVVARGHATASRADVGPGWGDRPARALRRLHKRTGHLPLTRNMYDVELRALVAGRYAEDLELVTSSAAAASHRSAARASGRSHVGPEVLR
jgi:hypothetical protein